MSQRPPQPRPVGRHSITRLLDLMDKIQGDQWQSYKLL